MKKKLLLTFVLVAIAICTLAFTASADSIHNENTVDYSSTVALNNGTTVNLFDSEGNALLWYLDANNELQSIRTDDQQVWWYTQSWDEVTDVGIKLQNGTNVNRSNFVVVNMMDDDVVKNSGSEQHFGKPVTNFKQLFQGCKKLEYVYLRLDTTGIFRDSFNGCSALKYINLPELTLLRDSRDGQQYGGCTSLFAGQVLDLSKTQLITLSGGGSLNGVPIVGLKLPDTLKSLGDWVFQGNPTTYFMFPEKLAAMPTNAFKNCSNLQTIYLNQPLTSIGDNAFLNCNSLEKICFVGSKSELEALVANTSATGNTAFFNVVGENNANLISYADYKKLADKSGKYAIYDYSYCEVYGEGIHAPVTLTNNCVGVCDTCGENVVKHNEDKNLSVAASYTSFDKEGVKTITCNNAGCGHKTTEKLPAILVCRGYSAPVNEDGRFAVGFDINNEAISTYEALTGKEFKFGVFAVLQSKLGSNDVLGNDGALTCDGIKAEVACEQYTSVELKISGFETDEHKALALAMGAYVDVDGEYSYIQAFAPEGDAKYSFISYNDIL